ncbi:MAG: hypothetical protein RIM33_13930 [Alphaproteobacteria bacterium]
MFANLSTHFVRASVLYALTGMTLGIVMAATQDHSQMPTHAHLMLLGWVGMTIYAVIYKLWPGAGEGGLPKLHAVVAHAALICLVIGLFLIYGGNVTAGDPLATVASFATIANTALFAFIVWRGTARS